MGSNFIICYLIQTSTIGLVTLNEMKAKQEVIVQEREKQLAKKLKEKEREIQRELEAKQAEKKKQKQQIRALSFKVEEEEEENEDDESSNDKQAPKRGFYYTPLMILIINLFWLSLPI